MTPFESQIRINKWQVDAARRQLADLVRLGERLREDLLALDAEIVTEREIAAAAELEVRLTYSSYLAAAKLRREALMQSIDDVDTRCEAARDALQEAFSELKKYELAAASAGERARKQRDRSEQKLQDELALTIFRRDE